MRFAPIVSILVACLALNAQTIQGKVVRVADGNMITILLTKHKQAHVGQPYTMSVVFGIDRLEIAGGKRYDWIWI